MSFQTPYFAIGNITLLIIRESGGDPCTPVRTTVNYGITSLLCKTTGKGQFYQVGSSTGWTDVQCVYSKCGWVGDVTGYIGYAHIGKDIRVSVKGKYIHRRDEIGVVNEIGEPDPAGGVGGNCNYGFNCFLFYGSYCIVSEHRIVFPDFHILGKGKLGLCGSRQGIPQQESAHTGRYTESKTSGRKKASADKRGAVHRFGIHINIISACAYCSYKELYVAAAGVSISCTELGIESLCAGNQQQTRKEHAGQSGCILLD